MSFPTTTQPESTDSERDSLMKLVAILGGGFPGAAATTSSGVPTQPKQYSTASSSIVTSDGNVGTIAAGQKMFIQNLDDAAVYVKYGTGASASSFTLELKAGSAANDGNGGSANIDDFIGIVSIAAAAATPRVVVTLLS